jgi:hypothetical protein
MTESEKESRRTKQSNYAREWRKKNREKHAKKQREWRAQNKSRAAEIWRRSRDKCIASLTEEQRAELHQRKLECNRKRNDGWQQVMNRCARWKQWEVQVIFDYTLRTSDIADLLGRSYKSIERARKRFKERAPAEWFKEKKS